MGALLLMGAVPTIAHGADAVVTAGTADTLPAGEIVVTGRAANLICIADSASEGQIGKIDLADRPIQRIGELLEVIPGFIATQHSGGGKANQYSCAASISTTGPTLPSSSTASRSTCGPTPTARASPISTSSSPSSSRRSTMPRDRIALMSATS